MSVTNLGDQTVNWKYKTPLKGSTLSKMMNGCANPGIYLRSGEPLAANTGIVFSYSGNQIILYPFEAIFKASATQTVHIGTSTSVNLYSDAGLGYVSAAYPYITMSYTWADQVLTYIDFAFKATYTKYDIVVGKAIFTGGTVTSIDYSEATHPPIYNPLTHSLILQNTGVQNLTVDQDAGVTGNLTVTGYSSTTGVSYTKNRDILSIPITTADYTLSIEEVSYRQIITTGILTGNRNLIFPTNVRDYKIICNNTGSYYITAKTANGTGVYIAPGDTADIYCDGTNIVALKTNSMALTFVGVSGTPTTSWVQLAFGTPTNDKLSEISGNAITIKNTGRIILTFSGGDSAAVGGTLSVMIYKNGVSYMAIARDTTNAGNAYVGAVGTIHIPVVATEVYTVWAQSTLGSMAVTGVLYYQRT